MSGNQPFQRSPARSVVAPVPNPAAFDDPLALRVEWSTLGSAKGNSHATHRFIESAHWRLDLVPNGLYKFLAVMLALLGLAMIFLALYGLVQTEEHMSPIQTGVLVVFALLIGGIGPLVLTAWIYHVRPRPIRVDRQSGWYYVDLEGTSDKPGSPQAGRDACRLRDIHAVQVLAYPQQLFKGYFEAQANLVLHDGRRVFVIGYDLRYGLAEAARRLAQWLQVPLWNAAVSPGTQPGTQMPGSG